MESRQRRPVTRNDPEDCKPEIRDAIHVSVDDILAHDVTGHLARLREDKLLPLISIGATKSGWGLTPRTRTYSKY